MESEGMSMPYVHIEMPMSASMLHWPLTSDRKITYNLNGRHVLYNNYPIKWHRVPFRVAGSCPYGEGTPLLVLMVLQLFGCPVQAANQYIRSSYHTCNVSSTKITSQKICTLYFRRLLRFDFEQNSCAEFHENPTNGLDAHTRSWPRIKQRHQHCYLFTWTGYVCDNCFLVSTAGSYGFKNATNRHTSKIIHTVKEYAIHTEKAVLKQDFTKRFFFRGIEVILTVRNLRLSQRRRRFRSSGMLRRVEWHIAIDLPNYRCVFETLVTT